MTLGNKVLKNASWLVGCQIARSILGLIISMLTARYLGPSNFGLINYAISITTFFLPIMQLGLNNILVQEFVNHPNQEGKILGTALTINVGASGLSILGVFAFTLVANAGEKETILVCALYSLCLICQAFEMIQYWFQAKLLSKYTAVISLIAYVIVSAYKIFLLITAKSVYWFAVSYAFDYGIIAAALIVIYHKIGSQKISFGLDVAKRILYKGRYYIVSNMMVTIFAQTDRVMLKLMVDDAATGYYSAAVSCAGMTSFLFVAIIDSMRPIIFECKKSSPQLYEENITRLYSVIIYLALAQSLLITLFAKPIVHILYGSAYDVSINALRLIVWYTTFSYMGSVRNIWILAENKQKLLWIINLSGALTNIVLNACLIPYWGIMGASFASLVTQLFTNFIIGYIIKDIRKNNSIILKSLNPKLLLQIVKRIIIKR